MHYQRVLKIPESISYFSVGFNVGIDFTQISVMFPNDIFIGKPLKITHSDPQSCELTISEIKEAQGMHLLKSCCFFKPTGIYHILPLCFLRGKGFDCAVINPIITKNNTNMNVRELHNNKFGLKKAAKADLDASLRASIVSDGTITGLRNLVRNYYYFKDLRPTIVLKLHVELKMSFPIYLSVFSEVTTQTSLKLLEAYPLAADILAVPKDKFMETARSTTHFGETYALTRYDAICIAAKDAVVFGRVLPSNVLRIRLYIKVYRGYQAHPDSILEELHQAIGKLGGTSDYDCISFTQALHGVDFLNAVVLITEVGSFDLSSSPKKSYAYFGLDPGMNDSDKSHGDRVHMPKQDSGLARCILHMVAVNSLKVDKATKVPVNPVIYDYYTHKCTSKRKSVAVGVIMHKICNIIFAMFRDNKPFELITSEGHRERYAVEHPESVNVTA